jgi:hypothetical protein
MKRKRIKINKKAKINRSLAYFKMKQFIKIFKKLIKNKAFLKNQ